MNSVFSTEKLLLVTVPESGFARLIVLDLTIEFDGSVYNLLLRGGLQDEQPAMIAGAVRDPNQAYVIVTAYASAVRLAHDIGLPAVTAAQILGTLERFFAPRLQLWLQDTQGRILGPDADQTQPVTPVALKPQVPTEPPAPEPLVRTDGDVLVTVDRDLSEVFGQPEGTYTLEYTLFNEPSVFRCILALHKGTDVKVVDFQKKAVSAIVQHLRSDNLAFEVASYFGSTDSHIVHLVGAVLKLGCAYHTRPPEAMVIGPDIPRPYDGDTIVMQPIRLPSPDELPIPLVAVDPAETVEVYNGGYFPLRG